ALRDLPGVGRESHERRIEQGQERVDVPAGLERGARVRVEAGRQADAPTVSTGFVQAVREAPELVRGEAAFGPSPAGQYQGVPAHLAQRVGLASYSLQLGRQELGIVPGLRAIRRSGRDAEAIDQPAVSAGLRVPFQDRVAERF